MNEWKDLIPLLFCLIDCESVFWRRALVRGDQDLGLVSCSLKVKWDMGELKSIRAVDIESEGRFRSRPKRGLGL